MCRSLCLSIVSILSEARNTIKTNKKRDEDRHVCGREEKEEDDRKMYSDSGQARHYAVLASEREAHMSCSFRLSPSASLSLSFSDTAGAMAVSISLSVHSAARLTTDGKKVGGGAQQLRTGKCIGVSQTRGQSSALGTFVTRSGRGLPMP